jgi:hypothetical protein
MWFADGLITDPQPATLIHSAQAMTITTSPESNLCKCSKNLGRGNARIQVVCLLAAHLAHMAGLSKLM